MLDPLPAPSPLAYAERILHGKGATGNEAAKALAEAFTKIPSDKRYLLEYIARENVKFKMLPEGETIPNYIPGPHLPGTRAAYYPKEKTCYIEHGHWKPGVILHELAHAVDHLFGLRLGIDNYVSATKRFTIDDEVFKTEAKAISDYAATNKQEYFAEALRLWMGVPEPEEGRWNHHPEAIENPQSYVKKVAPKVVKFIEEINERLQEEVKKPLTPGFSPGTALNHEETERKRKSYLDDVKLFEKKKAGDGDIYSWPDTGKPALYDDGKSISLLDWGIHPKRDEQTLRAGLALMHTRYKSIQLNGPPEFKAQALRIAVEMGILISNPELQRKQAALRQEAAHASHETPVMKSRS